MAESKNQTWHRYSTSEQVKALSERLLALSIKSLETDIEEFLSYLGHLLEVGRSYVVFLDDEGKRFENILECVCEPGIKSHERASLYGLSIDTFGWSLSQFQRGVLVLVNKVSELPPEARAERQLCTNLKIKSYVNLPLFDQGKLMGWLGFDSVEKQRTWRTEDLKLISMSGALLTHAFTHKKRDRERLQERELAQRLTSMGTLAAGLAHEINNPLSYVYSNLGMAQELLDSHAPVDSLSPDTASELRELLSLTRDGIEQVRRIVGDLRSFTRPSIELEDSDGAVDLIGVLDATTRMVSSLVKHRATLTCDYAGVPHVRGSASKLGQVFLNLIMNAYQSLPEGRANDHRIRISAHVEGPEDIVVDVEDNGRGISPDILPKIFNPYFTTRADAGGTGIGLALCLSIIRELNGQIEVRSKLNKGTRFRVVLKRSHTKTTDHYSSASFNALKISPRRVLLVDDNKLIQKSFKRVLRAHEVELASSGEEAIEVLKHDQDFDIIICDLHMPNGTGEDVFTYLKKHLPKLAERLVFLTGGASSEDMRSFLERVPNLSIAKPCDNHDLRALVLEMSLLETRR